ncbi:MAG: hypothetical protein M3O30_03545 [Planctomycetota bacterium]|nr:hypothetical protein [Planctomycetota bacterium]
MNLPVSPPPRLAEEHLRQLGAARINARKINRAVSVAKSDGWVIAVFAGLTLVFGLTDIPSIIISLIFGALAFFELKGAGKLRRLDPDAPRMLGYNQIAMAVMLIAYASWHIVSELTGHGELNSALGTDPQVREMLQSSAPLIRSIMLGFYGLLIAIAIFCQGGMALYYFSRLKYLEAYVKETPPWILAMQKAGMSI